MPPPSTVSMVLASRFGVTASKSCVREKSLASPAFDLDQQTNGGVNQAYLQDTHAERVSQDLVGLVVVAVADVGSCDEELKRVVLVQVQRPRFDLLLQLLHAFLAIAARASGDTSRLLRSALDEAHWSRRSSLPAESQVLLVAPEDRRSSSDCSFGQHVMKNNNLHGQQRSR